MKKNGFVFIESIVVLMVVTLSLTMLISSYSLISRKTKEKENYDNASDKYLLYAISTLGTDATCNYGNDCNGTSVINFRADNYDGKATFSCEKTKFGKLVFDCHQLMDDMKLVHLYVVKNVRNALQDKDDKGNAIKTVSIYDNGTIEYMKTLKSCNDLNEITESGEYINNNKITDTCNDPITYMIGVFAKNDNNVRYYASIEV